MNGKAVAVTETLRWSRRAYGRVNGRISPVTFAITLDDHRVIERALRPRPGDRVLCLASAGDTPLNLLAQHPAEIIAVDRDPGQLALAELKAAALACLSPDEVHRFLGIRAADDRLRLYAALRPRLRPATAAFWDEWPALVRDGVVWCGAINRMARIWGPLVRLRRGGTMADNPYLAPLLLRRMPASELLPPYLAPAFQPAVRGNLHRLRWVHADLRRHLREVPEHSIDCFALSNVGDWLSSAQLAHLLGEVVRTARPGARVLVCAHRRRLAVPAALRPVLTADPALERELLAVDRVGYLRRILALRVGGPA
ncbi:DUF3419 family protein [Micromonosporaceae bacterium B7E4]